MTPKGLLVSAGAFFLLGLSLGGSCDANAQELRTHTIVPVKVGACYMDVCEVWVPSVCRRSVAGPGFAMTTTYACDVKIYVRRSSL